MIQCKLLQLLLMSKQDAVIAQIGGRNQTKQCYFGFNQAVQTDRDWGSTMKPIVTTVQLLKIIFILQLIIMFPIPQLLIQMERL